MKSLIFAVFALFPYFGFAQSRLPDLCAKTCVINAECGIGGLCDQGQCRYENSYCFNERWSVNDRGEKNNCDAYSCAPDTGLCLRVAKTSQDCLPGYVFDGTSACIASVQCNLSDPACESLYERWKKARNDYEASTPEPSIPLLSCIPCVHSESCGAGNMCWQNHCEMQKSFCSVDEFGEHFAINALNIAKSCGSYVCDKVSSSCLSNCLKNNDCRSGKMCVAGSCL